MKKSILEVAKEIINGKTSINEEVYGGLSTVFHRTGGYEDIEAIQKSGFRSGESSMYGRGIYTTYSLKSQLNAAMGDNYGEYIIKSKINNNRILFLDTEQAKKVYGENYSLVDQLKIINPALEISKKIQKISNRLLKNPKYTSDYALEILEDKSVKKSIYGISFTGKQDGQVLVVYKPELITPMSFNSTMDEWDELDSNKWENISNMKMIRKGLNKTLSGFDKK